MDQHWSKSSSQKRIEELAEQLSLKHLLHRLPEKLSGGEAKRVALGRAVATHPKLLCLDEALTGLDDKSYAETLELLESTIKQAKITTLHNTPHHPLAHRSTQRHTEAHRGTQAS